MLWEGGGDRRQATRVETGGLDEDGFLIFVDNALAAVVVRLEDQVHEHSRGRWFLEAGFGRCAMVGGTLFDTPEDAQQWVLQRVRH